MRPHALARPALAAPRAARPLVCAAANSPPPDVSRNVVRREVRAPPLAEEAARPDLPSDGLCLAFVSESGYCRAPLAAAAARRALAALSPPLSSPVVICEALASRDYCAGRPPSPDAAAVAATRGLADPAFSAARATPFLPATHAVRADLLAVVDRFVAADVLREVTVFDTVAAGETAAYGSKVRLLGGFAKAGDGGGEGSGSAVDALVAASAAGEGEDSDIDDPLYGNGGGPAQAAAVDAAAAACEAGAGGLVAWLGALDREATVAGIPLRAALSGALGTAGEITWLVPPMLAPRG